MIRCAWDVERADRTRFPIPLAHSCEQEVVVVIRKAVGLPRLERTGWLKIFELQINLTMAEVSTATTRFNAMNEGTSLRLSKEPTTL